MLRTERLNVDSNDYEIIMKESRIIELLINL